MSSHSNSTIDVKEGQSLSSRYLEWFLEVGAEKQDGEALHADFDDWLISIKKTSLLDADMLENLEKAQLKLKQSVKDGNIQDHKALFKSFHDKIQLCETQVLLEKAGHDSLTGLRSKVVLNEDLTREMERLSRDGRPFSIALARIDDFDEIKDKLGHDQAEEYVRRVAHNIDKALRAFDNAYRIGPAEFVLSLIQAESAGGVKALERLKKQLESDEIEIKDGVTQRKHISLSCRVMEPVAGDHIDDIMESLRRDLDNTEREGDSVFECFEMSPIQQFVQQQ